MDGLDALKLFNEPRNFRSVIAKFAEEDSTNDMTRDLLSMTTKDLDQLADHPAKGLAAEDQDPILTLLQALGNYAKLTVKLARALLALFGMKQENRWIIAPGSDVTLVDFRRSLARFKTDSAQHDTLATDIQNNVTNAEIKDLLIPYARLLVGSSARFEEWLEAIDYFAIKNVEGLSMADRKELKGAYPHQTWVGFAWDPNSETFDMAKVKAWMPGDTVAKVRAYATVQPTKNRLAPIADQMSLLLEAVPALRVQYDEIRAECNDADAFVQTASVLGILHIRPPLMEGTPEEKLVKLAPTARIVRDVAKELGLWTQEAREANGFPMTDLGGNFRYVQSAHVAALDDVAKADSTGQQLVAQP